jgi:hypothetical protein
MAAHRKMPKDELFAQLALMRSQGMTSKQIAKALGVYTAGYIAVLCGEWGLRIKRTTMHCDAGKQSEGDLSYNNGQEGAP